MILCWALTIFFETVGLQVALLFIKADPMLAEPGLLASNLTRTASLCAGAFIFGTLTKKNNTWIKTALFLSPQLFAIRLFLPVPHSIFSFVAYLGLGFLGVLFACNAGSNSNFNKPDALLNINWKNWLWIIPLALFQTISVPLFLLVAIFQTDYFLNGASPFSFFAIALRLGFCLAFLAVSASVYAFYNILAQDTRPTAFQRVQQFVIWIIVTAIQTMLFLFQMAKGAN